MPAKTTKTKSTTKGRLFNDSRLYRSETNKVLAGVCGGLGDFFNVDPTLVRLIFILITFFGGGGILLYLILWLIIPSQNSITEITGESIKKNADEIKERAQKFAEDLKSHRFEGRRENSRQLFGIILLILGVMFLFSNIGIFKIFNFEKLWPVFLIILGLAIFIRGGRD